MTAKRTDAPDRYELERHERPGDRWVKASVLLRPCADPDCSETFAVMPHRPVADYCRSNACKKRRQYRRRKLG